MKIKLRDLTLEQYKIWNMHNCHFRKCDDCVFENVLCVERYDCCWVNHKDLYSDNFLDQEIEVDE